MSTTNTPNMNLPIPGVGNEAGPDYADDVNNCLTILDGHSHATGSGVQITPNALNLNSDVTFLGNNATTLRSVRMSSQSGALAGGSDLGCLYNNAGELYYNDGSGNHVAITASGGVAGSPGSIANLVSPASATYTAGSKLFTWASGTSGKAAAMDNGAVTIRQTDTASAKGVTLASPNALAADYQLTMPTALPGSTLYLNVDSSGNMSTVASSAGANSIGSIMTSTGANAIGATMTSTGANAIGASMTSSGSNAVAASRTRTVGTTATAGNIALSASCGDFNTSSTTFVDVTNLTVTITTSGRPVMLQLVPDGSASKGELYGFNANSDQIGVSVGIYKGAGNVAVQDFWQNPASPSSLIIIPASSFVAFDAVVAGTYTYQIALAVNVGTTIGRIRYAKLLAYEL